MLKSATCVPFSLVCVLHRDGGCCASTCMHVCQNSAACWAKPIAAMFCQMFIGSKAWIQSKRLGTVKMLVFWPIMLSSHNLYLYMYSRNSCNYMNFFKVNCINVCRFGKDGLGTAVRMYEIIVQWHHLLKHE